MSADVSWSISYDRFSHRLGYQLHKQLLYFGCQGTSSHLVDWIWQEHSVHHCPFLRAASPTSRSLLGQCHHDNNGLDHYHSHDNNNNGSILAWCQQFPQWQAKAEDAPHRRQSRVHPPTLSIGFGKNMVSITGPFLRAASPASGSLLGQCCHDSNGLDHYHSHDDNDNGSILAMTPQRHHPQ